MALTRYLTLGLLTVAGAPMAFAQKPPEHADTLFVEVEISSGGNLYTACKEHGFADKDLADCWGTAVAANYAAIDNPHRIQPGTFYLKKTPDMLAVEIASLKDAPAAAAQTPALSTQGVSDDDYRMALSDASRWKSQFEALQGENQKLLTELGELKLDNENLAADLGLAKNTLGYWQRIVQTMKDEAAKAPLDQAAAEEILRSQGPPPVNLDDTTGVTFEAKDAEILFYKWLSLGFGVSILALAAALAWMARTRPRQNEPAVAKPAKDKKTLRGRLSSLRQRVMPRKPEPRREPPSGAEATAYYDLGPPKGAPSSTAKPRSPRWGLSLPAAWTSRRTQVKATPPEAKPAPASAPEPAAVHASPALAPVAEQSLAAPEPGPLGPPDQRGYYYAEHEFTLWDKCLLKGHSPMRRTAIRFDGKEVWQARLPRGGWANLLDDYAKKLVEQSDCFDHDVLNGAGFKDNPAIIFKDPPAKEFFTSKIPAQTTEEVAS